MNKSVNIQQACAIFGVSRQAFYKKSTVLQTTPDSGAYLQSIWPDLKKARTEHPTQGCRAMYEEYGKSWALGRDKSLEILLNGGFRVKYPKNYGRATQSGTRPFPNLLVCKHVSGVNQVWQADMAYYLGGPKPVYTIYITDVYTQEIVGYGAYSTNHAVNYREVLERAIAQQAGYTKSLKGLIHHSDGGKQYESKVYTELCEEHNITQSMCMFSYENPYAEKTNDLINNGYLNIWKPKSLASLRKAQAKAVLNHNSKRRKKRLGKLSPLDFKAKIVAQQPFGIPYILELKPKNPAQPRARNLSSKSNSSLNSNSNSSFTDNSSSSSSSTSNPNPN